MKHETVKSLLDYILRDHGINDDHELYEIFDTVFRVGLNWGGDYDRAFIRSIFRNETDGYLYAINSNGETILEDEKGNVLAGGIAQ